MRRHHGPLKQRRPAPCSARRALPRLRGPAWPGLHELKAVMHIMTPKNSSTTCWILIQTCTFLVFIYTRSLSSLFQVHVTMLFVTFVWSSQGVCTQPLTKSYAATLAGCLPGRLQRRAHAAASRVAPWPAHAASIAAILLGKVFCSIGYQVKVNLASVVSA